MSNVDVVGEDEAQCEAGCLFVSGDIQCCQHDLIIGPLRILIAVNEVVGSLLKEVVVELDEQAKGDAHLR